MFGLKASIRPKQTVVVFESILLISIGAALIAIAAQMPLHVPLFTTDIPGTWQTFAVLVFAYVNRPHVSILSVVLYLVLGIFGLPVYADGSSGYSVLIGNTGGYLYGFALGAGIIASIGVQYPTRDFFTGLLAMSIGTFTILTCGVLHLSNVIGMTNALTYGLYPFLLGALIKIVLGAAVFPFYQFYKRHLT